MAQIENGAIALFTDFGLDDPYVGQLHAVLAREAPGAPIIDLFHAVPNFDVRAAAYLLPAYTASFAPGTVFICVVDPGVGGPRLPVAVKADERWYVGPDNGLFSILTRRAGRFESYVIRWRPTVLSSSFHGRDLFAPIAAKLARAEVPEWASCSLTMPNWPDDLAQIVYIDHYGNAITGLRGATVRTDQRLRIGKRSYSYARVFSEAPRGKGFWYTNSNGLIELAVEKGSIARRFGLRAGMRVQINKKDK